MKRCLGYILMTAMACAMMTYYFMAPLSADVSLRLNSITAPFSSQEMPWWRQVLCEGINQQGFRLTELPWLLRDVTPNATDDNIFLVETACKTTPSFRVWCAVESWSRQNPSSQVWYVMTSLTVNDTDGLVSRLQEEYKNLRIVGADVEKIFKGTGLNNLFSSRKWIIKAKWPPVKLSDMLRVALVWRWGGFYTDTDTVCIKDVSPLRNIISFSDSKLNKISNGAFQFQQHHKFLELLMDVQTKSFAPGSWGSLGPAAVTAVAKRMCNTTDFRKLPGDKNEPLVCGDLSLLPQKYLLPLPWTEYSRLFAKGTGEKFFSQFNSTYVIHLFSAMSRKRKLHIGDNSIYEIAAKHFCPVTFQHATANSDFF
ncbi:lactosylceramide 4-alpha-galactosyltransferase-like isoform X2 [Penaeus japonicus]|uniref:lactosylceramide 4-alpha-galactosyltransferase-like isoform X2 n=1 Tax=Penaeus japonicus TaxID=27405 RepID=UPI001C71389A|nr:lactosylceramide 4-alpha-galactosyltransferase-like isoform X2 [Penaeus japonicus]